MRKWLKIAFFLAVLLVLGSAYDFWRGYHEHKNIWDGIRFAILGWFVFAPIVLFDRFLDEKVSNPKLPTTDSCAVLIQSWVS